MSSSLRWLGPLAAIGGAALAIYGFTKGKNWAKFTGISTGLSGIATTIMGFKANGVIEGTKAGRAQGIAELSQQVQEQLGPQIDAQNQKIAQQAALIAQLQGQGTGTGTGGTTGGTIGQGTTGQATGQTGTGTTGTDTTGTGAATTQASSADQAAAIPEGQWTPSLLAGQAVALGIANMPGGQTVAEGGNYVIVQQLGAPAGYATAAEGDTAAQSGMSTDLQGTKNYRWLVVEHGGKYFSFAAMKDQNSSKLMPAANGNVVAWHALRAVETGAFQVQWVHYAYNKDTGGTFTQVGNLDAAAAAAATPAIGGTGGGGGTTATPIGGTQVPGVQTSPTVGNAPATGAQPSGSTVTGGGAASVVSPAPTPAVVATPAWQAASLVGTGLAIADTNGAKGGVLQLQALLGPSQNGFATIDQAASAIRLDRQATLNSTAFSRWVTVQGADGKFYAYSGSIVRRDVPPITQGSSAVHVFGDGFAEYYDGSAWHANADSGL